jgi:hypothetical protein
MLQTRDVETDRAKYWRSVVGQWEWSGLSQAEFCRQQAINGGTFAWWKRQLKKLAGPAASGMAVTSGTSQRRGQSSKAAPARFVEVRLTGASSGSIYEVVLVGGRSIRVSAQFDSQTLSRLITAVESC